MNVLVTGFEAFDTLSLNPSWEAVKLLPKEIADAHVETMQLPVVYGLCGEKLREKIIETRPAFVLCTGVAGSRDAVTPELIAINWRMARIPDNAGRLCNGEKIEPDAPDGCMTKLDVVALAEKINAAGVRAAVSTTAGAYVCNDLYWAALRMQEEYGYRALFVHVPPMETIASADVAKALEICIEQGIEKEIQR